MIVVTGATGSLGSNLTRALVQQGEKVAILRREDDPCASIADIVDEVAHRIGDVRDPDAVDEALADAEAVYHLAGVTTPSNALRGLMREVNIGGTRNVMGAAWRRRARVVHTSSIAAVGYPDAGTIADENFPYNGAQFRHAYVDTKRSAELLVLDYIHKGLDAVILNPTGTLAPGGSTSAGWAGLVAQVAAGRVVAYPGGGVGVLNTRDLVDAQLKAMKSGQTGERYIVNSANLTYRELITEIATVLGVAAPRWRIPDRALSAAALALAPIGALIRDPHRKPLLRKENVALLTRTMFYDNGKAHRMLGTTTTPLRESIEDVAAWCARQGGLR